MKSITLLITDDHKILRETWRMVLDADPAFNVLGTCGSGEEALDAARRLQPQIIIMDINLPRMNGFEATRIITNQSPHTKVLGYSLHNEPSYARKMFAAGAMGYITKTSSLDEMKAALLSIHGNQHYVCGELKVTKSAKSNNPWLTT